jgi:alkanesulfonate monooxygenase SsuD/methylene tetrahydromethanopterin reductase-like flavin-dependent oxidoreductase (luciferase family)
MGLDEIVTRAQAAEAGGFHGVAFLDHLETSRRGSRREPTGSGSVTSCCAMRSAAPRFWPNKP